MKFYQTNLNNAFVETPVEEDGESFIIFILLKEKKYQNIVQMP